MARKLERWCETLDDDERDTLNGWMAAGMGREQLAAGRRWWFDPDADDAHPRRVDAQVMASVLGQPKPDDVGG